MFKYTISLTPAVPKPACHAASILPSKEVKASSENFDAKRMIFQFFILKQVIRRRLARRPIIFFFAFSIIYSQLLISLYVISIFSYRFLNICIKVILKSFSAKSNTYVLCWSLSIVCKSHFPISNNFLLLCCG